MSALQPATFFGAGADSPPMEAVLFDMDGVVVDSESYWVAREEDFFEEVVPDADVEEITGMNYREVYEYVEEHYGVSVEREAFLGWYEDTAEEVYGERASLMDGFPDLAGDLRAAGAHVALVTSSPQDWYEIVLERFDLEGAFDATVSAEEVERGKPAPDVYEHAAGTLGVDPADCVAVEDSANGAKAAVDAGMACIGYRPDGSDLPEADRVVHGPDELREALFSVGGFA